MDQTTEKKQQPEAIETAFVELRDDLKRLVQTKLDRRLLGRVDASDIIQETYLTAFRRYGEFVANPEVPLSDWIRFLTLQTVQTAHRVHLLSQKRTVGKEAESAPYDNSKSSLAGLTQVLVGSLTSPQSAAMRAELNQAIAAMVASLSDVDREILRLRHEEHLTNQQCAEHMGISERAASKRYISALRRLRHIAGATENV